LPMKELGSTFNINYFIVSQVNPHILPYFFWNAGAPGTVDRSLKDENTDIYVLILLYIILVY
jgi:hypothetical protein